MKHYQLSYITLCLVLLCSACATQQKPIEPAQADLTNLNPMAWEKIKSYDMPNDRSALIAVEENIRHANPAQKQAMGEMLIGVLQDRQATHAANDFAMRMMARIPSEKFIPVLEHYLYQEDYSHMARFALQSIQSPQADAVLRDALIDTEGEILIGVISSVAQRNDEKAIPLLAKIANQPDEPTAEAAIHALGRIQSKLALKALLDLHLMNHELDKARINAIMRQTR
ncbi:hypothetical protein GF373_11925 [bacterium]|nr:hypothetical protein [bacterium]